MPNPRILARNFKDHVAELDDLFLIYKDSYDIPYIKSEIKITDQESFSYCKDRKHFVMLLPFGRNKDILLTETFFDNRLRWLPIAGSVRIDLKENYLESAIRLANSAYPGVELGELEPIAILGNHFSFGEKECSHFGIAFISRIRNSDPYHDLYNNKSIRAKLISYYFIKNKEFVDREATQWDKVLALTKEYIENRNIYNLQENEISGYARKKRRYQIHNRVTKPLLSFFGKILFNKSVQDVNEKIKELVLVDNPKTLIDIACGDNSLAVDIAQIHDFNLVVANDLSWQQLESLRTNISEETFKNSNSLVIFTNHDAKSLPFKNEYFDVLLCKNVLHHMDNFEYLTLLMNEMLRVSKKVVIVEILDPKYEGGWGRTRHRYIYDKLLHEMDAGDNFLSRAAFKEITALANCTDTFEIRTIRAIYQFAVLNPHSRSGTNI
jgi:ubiquinone/menaquinone biosynthesis C-methylase UbiE